MWLLYAVGSSFFAGITAILVKIGVEDTDSHLLTALRTIVVLIFSWIMVFVVGSQGTISEVSPKTLLFLCASGITTGASWICYFHALQIGDVNKVVPIDKSSVVLTILLGVLFLGEPMSVSKGICVILIAAGTYLMIEKKQGTEEGKKKSKSAILYALLSAVFASLTALLSKIGIVGIESNLGTAIRTIIVLIMAWLIVLAGGKQKQIRDVSRKSWTFIILSGIATGLSWLCYYRALQDGPISVVLPIDKLSILISIAFAYIIFKERLTRRSGLGLAMIVTGTLGMVVL
ncbi:EamA family transporter [[Clostridium] scindens]|uniref:EamA family transporter n=1 Tax=Clostridium scindens (strain JCM 10418 / VPI 12708) TaxID=29347 RepID=UPI00046EFD3F|nr:EamA family transporter [[Clostridium] scindens]MCB6284808.1 EamA family transporter [[Clostridium] scindens]MCB6419554.1 EamA family transporter [[Clostridium] scindens]MCB6644952.1 EamA family transporter [[Clostridium] scindens]MCB7191183.1 EamA family transporter [[Clostridium] scindens]MCB7284143.1 EamA family transporter [[Clostridium] scindens]